MSIEIPTIQRDYAHGRSTERIKLIRENFIRDIIKALEMKDEHTKIHLDFIYGKEEGKKSQEVIRRNKQSLEDLLISIRSYADNLDLVFEYDNIKNKNEEDEISAQRLLPLDGQQRLTTLFLLHWYIAKRLDDIESIKILRRFTYKTRRSSSSFIRTICHESLEIDFDPNDLQKEIELQHSFSNTWLKDPTVRGMLVVLNFIHSLFIDKPIETLRLYWDKLTKTETICFDYLDLVDFELSDDLYVKMNARGKQLSDFENFKAWLLNIVERDEYKLGVENWDIENYKLDIEWNDIFWFSRGNNTIDIDENYFYYFRLSFLGDYINNYKKDRISEYKKHTQISSEPQYYKQSDIIGFLESDDNIFEFEHIFACDLFKKKLPKYLQFLEYLKVGDNGNNIKQLNQILSKPLCEDTQSIFSYYLDPKIDFGDLFFSEKCRKTNWWQKTYFFAIQKYVLELRKPLLEYSNEEKLNMNHYNRVISNLIFNTRIESPDVFNTAIESINHIFENIDINKSIYQQETILNGTRFVNDQRDEEILKCSLIQNDNEWEEIFIKAEQHEYFYGQINFLLELSSNDRDKFISTFEKVAPLFNYSFLSNNKKLFQRALLTKGNYFVDRNGLKCFCKSNMGTVRERNENWRLFLNSKDKIKLLEELVNDELFDVQNIDESLEKITDRYITMRNITNINIKNLEYYDLYILDKRMFQYGDNGFIKLDNDQYAYQLNKSNTSGYFHENITYFIQQHIQTEDKYKPEIGWTNRPYACFNINDEAYTLILCDETLKLSKAESSDVYAQFKTIGDAISELNLLLACN